MVLREIDLTVENGEVVALLGPNGAGKTTLLRTATGFVKPRSGEVHFAGEDFTGRPPYRYVPPDCATSPKDGASSLPSPSQKTSPSRPAADKVDAMAVATELFPALAACAKPPAAFRRRTTNAGPVPGLHDQTQSGPRRRGLSRAGPPHGRQDL